MKLHEVNSTEVGRLDLICIRYFGTYTSAMAEKIVDANPTVDFTNLAVGDKVKIPDREDLLWSE